MNMDFRQAWTQVLKQGCHNSYVHDLHFSGWLSSELKKNFYSLMLRLTPFNN